MSVRIRGISSGPCARQGYSKLITGGIKAQAHLETKALAGALCPSRRTLFLDPEAAKEPSDQGLNKILDFIHKCKGLDLSSYRQSFLYRRLRLRIFSTKARGCLEYIALLKNNPEEYANFLDALSINVTEFFRDPDVFEAVKKVVLPQLITRKKAQNNLSLRIWSSACASGEEPYSIAILIKQSLGEKSNFLVRIWASDIDRHALQNAKKAEYPAKELKNLDSKIIKKYFISCGNNCCQPSDEDRKSVV